MDSKAFINNLSQIIGEDTARINSLLDSFVSILRSSATTMTIVAIPSFGSFVPTKTDEEIITDRSSGKRLLLPPQITLEFQPAAKLRKAMFAQAGTISSANENTGRETVNLPKLISQISEIADCNPTITRRFLHELFALIESNLLNGEAVVLKGVGEFVKTDTPSNPIKFLADKTLADIANEPFAAFEAVEIGDGLKDEDLIDTPKENKNQTLPPATIEAAPKAKPDDKIEAVSTTEVADSEQTTTSETEAETTEASDSHTEAEVKEQAETQPEAETKSETAHTEVPNNTTEEQTIDDVPDETKPLEEETEEETQEYYVPKQRNSNSGLWLIVGLLIGLIIGLVGGFFAGKAMAKFDDVDKIAHEADSLKTVNTKVVEADSIISKADTITAQPSPVAKPTTKPISEPVYDMVKNKRYLTTMAREHYGNYKYWVFIYEANPGLGNPNQISIGTKILIPEKESFFEETDEKTLEKAQKVLNKIAQKYKL